MIAKTLAIFGLLLLCTSAAQALEPLPSGATVALLRAPEARRSRELEAGLSEATRRLGYRVMSADAVAVELRDSEPGLCSSSSDCRLSALRTQLDVDAVALFVLLPGGGPPQLLVRVAREAGENEATHELGGEEREAALRRVMGHALGGRNEIKLTTVLITSVPPHALVSLDRKPVQEAPARFVVVPGKHTIRGRLRGYAPVVEQVEIPVQSSPFDYQLTLPQQLVPDPQTLQLPDTAAEPYQPTPIEQPSTWNYVLAGGLGAAAIGLGTYTVLLAKQNGDCAKRTKANDACYSEYDNDMAMLGAGLGAGVSALGALSVLIWTPITVSAAPDLRSVTLRFSGHL